VLRSKDLLILVFGALGFRIRVTGYQNIVHAHKQKAVIVFNHVSWLDAFVLVWLAAPSGVALEFNKNIPILSHAVRALQTVYIPNKKSGVGVTSLLLKRTQDPLYGSPSGFPLLVIAPEGTCSNGRCLLTFRTGAFVLQRPILPILFKYKCRYHNPAWTLNNIVFNFLRLLCQFVNYLDVDIMPVYNPSPAELNDPQLYTGNVRALMAETLGVPMVNQSRSDYVALVKAGVRVCMDGRTVVMPA
jgi:lysophosphatidylcholine acyltransferase/lyso-PAF acetyltransferase